MLEPFCDSFETRCACGQTPRANSAKCAYKYSYAAAYGKGAMTPAFILCVGKDPGLLRSRCSVLEHAGYRVQTVMCAEADEVLREGGYDLIILSAILNDEEREHISERAEMGTPILTLKKLTFASELLTEVGRKLRPQAQRSLA